jgi:hypothetical protein
MLANIPYFFSQYKQILKLYIIHRCKQQGHTVVSND